MTEIPLTESLLLASTLFLIGMLGLLIRRNMLYLLMSVEIMLNAAGLAFIVAGAYWGQPDGQVMFIFILAMAAAEVSVGLALILQMHRLTDTVDVNILSLLSDRIFKDTNESTDLSADENPNLPPKSAENKPEKN